MTKHSNNTCDGCGKPLTITQGTYGCEEELAASIEIAPNVEVRVCGSTRYNGDYYKHDTQYAPKIGCLRKAFESADVCPGCGGKRERGLGAYGGICGTCAEHIERAKATLGDDKPVTYSLHIDLISSTWPDSSTLAFGDGVTPRDFAEKLLDTIARVAQSTGPRKGPDQLSTGRGLRLPLTPGHAYGYASIELDNKQREAIEQLGSAVKLFADAMYHQGRKDGRDLLGGLATGTLSIRDFEEKHKNWTEEEDKEN